MIERCETNRWMKPKPIVVYDESLSQQLAQFEGVIVNSGVYEGKKARPFAHVLDPHQQINTRVVSPR